ncbi:START domain-containing protein [uncultured Mucilaginibacter sp.]|uniref:START domain-containing protein n=1 Tax=uncultured Mucilaginibacter sp. TaxID=797541 RepID=UPI0025D34A12|nr:START domain-containing protein [uncultured Mucilaginibacter sp.]
MYRTLLVALMLVLKAVVVAAQCDWKLSTEREGIKIYTGGVPGSTIKAIKVEAMFNATAAQLVALIMDVNTSPDWVYHTKSSKLIKQVSASELYYYSEVSLPWPAANRDFVAHLIVTQNPDTKVITIDGPAVAGFIPVKEGIVRIIDSKGKWIITPIGTNQIKVEYSIHVDPGGSLPSWLVNMFATEGPLKIFAGIKVQLQKSAYKNIEFAFAH